MMMLVACGKDLSEDIQDHFENNRYFYEGYAQEASSKNGTLTYSVEKNSLVLTSTISIAMKDGQLNTFKKVLETSLDDSHADYNELLDKLQTDLPEATFIVRFVDQNRNVIVEKEFK